MSDALLQALAQQVLAHEGLIEDLLFLDRPNLQLAPEQRDRYAQLGLPAGPFDSVAVYAPPRKGDPHAGLDVSSRTQLPAALAA